MKTLAKATTLALVLCFASIAAHAANINRGNVAVGGYLTLTRAFPNAAQRGYFSVGLSPSAEYFFMDHWSLGGTGNFSYSKSDNSSSYTYYGIGPSTTLYFYTQESWAVFTGLSLTYNHYQRATSTYDLSPRLGLAFFLNPAVALSPEVRFVHRFYDESYGTVDGDDTLQFGVSLNVYL